MIGRIAGIVIHRAADHVLIDVRGVGYIVHVSERTAAALRLGEAAALITELVVREDLLQLYGFPTLLEKEWHRLLTSVQGVGPKASLALLGTLGPDGVARAIALGDSAAVRKAPGVGPKLAQRVVMELKDKAPAVMALGGTLAADPGPLLDPETDTPAKPAARRPAPAADPSALASAEALSALSNLGYAPAEAASAVAEASGAEPTATTAALIRAALRLLAPKE